MNHLPSCRRVDVLSLMLEGCSLRAMSRQSGVHRSTIMHLLVDAGRHSYRLLKQELRDLSCPIVEADARWAFWRTKERPFGCIAFSCLSALRIATSMSSRMA